MCVAQRRNGKHVNIFIYNCAIYITDAQSACKNELVSPQPSNTHSSLPHLHILLFFLVSLIISHNLLLAGSGVLLRCS